MRVVVQRVKNAKVSVDDKVVGEIADGLLLYIGVGNEDTSDDMKYVAKKVPNLRIFEDQEGKMNLSLLDISGEILAISQFTLYGDCRNGRRPSFTTAAEPKIASKMYDDLVSMWREEGIVVSKGIFQADMQVHSVNDGPVTMLIDSRKQF